MRLSLSAIYIYFLLSACVTPFDVSTSYQPAIVVQGMITDQPGPYVVTISTTLPINDQLDEPPMVTGATVVINDDQGNTETLKEKSPGNYYTSVSQGVVGRSYSLSITTSEGNSYQSALEELLPVGDFSNLTYKFVQNEAANANNQISSTNGFNIFMDSQVLPEQGGRVWWRWTGTFEIFTYPELQKKILSDEPTPGTPFADHGCAALQRVFHQQTQHTLCYTRWPSCELPVLYLLGDTIQPDTHYFRSEIYLQRSDQ